MIPQAPRARRQAFTLIEILVVITIIGILAALILAAVNYVNRGTVELSNRNDILGLNAAILKFKQEYGFYPPSRIKLCSHRIQYGNPPATKLDVDSIKYITTMFPKIGPAWASVQGIQWNTRSASVFPKTGVILEGDQCLVFFLGGIQQPIQGGQPAKCLGFSTNPKDPSDITNLTNRKGPYYNFDTARLSPRMTSESLQQFIANPVAGGANAIPWGCDPNGGGPGNPARSHGSVAADNAFYSYLDNYLKKPYVYFSSGGLRNGYHPADNSPAGYTVADCIWTGNWTSGFKSAPMGDQYLVGPVYQSASPPGGAPLFPNNALIGYPNEDSFQIISAGADTIYGRGVAPYFPIPGQPANGPNFWSATTAPSYEATWTQIDGVTNPNAPGGNGQDDMANFYGSQLKVAQ